VKSTFALALFAYQSGASLTGIWAFVVSTNIYDEFDQFSGENEDYILASQETNLSVPEMLVAGVWQQTVFSIFGLQSAISFHESQHLSQSPHVIGITPSQGLLPFDVMNM